MNKSTIDQVQEATGERCSQDTTCADGCDFAAVLSEYQRGNSLRPLFLQGDSACVLRALPANSFDCCMTSPPYWGQRQYAASGIGLEGDYRQYVRDLLLICGEVRRTLKPTGSFWLNIGDVYDDKRLLGIPWRVALEMTDQQGWILRNDVVWNKVKGWNGTRSILWNRHDKSRGVSAWPAIHRH